MIRNQYEYSYRKAKKEILLYYDVFHSKSMCRERVHTLIYYYGVLNPKYENRLLRFIDALAYSS